MESSNLVPKQQFCEIHQIEFSFIDRLNEYGLVDVISVGEIHYLHVEQIKNIEKMIHMHYELDINIEGIEVITNLLSQVDNLHEELRTLKNKLDFYGQQTDL